MRDKITKNLQLSVFWWSNSNWDSAIGTYIGLIIACKVVFLETDYLQAL
jgi:hypothetical protein